jgi:bacterioferritin (cytochrome b1)
MLAEIVAFQKYKKHKKIFDTCNFQNVKKKKFGSEFETQV